VYHVVSAWQKRGSGLTEPAQQGHSPLRLAPWAAGPRGSAGSRRRRRPHLQDNRR
jgi:hypothetical protein